MDSPLCRSSFSWVARLSRAWSTYSSHGSQNLWKSGCACFILDASVLQDILYTGLPAEIQYIPNESHSAYLTITGYTTQLSDQQTPSTVVNSEEKTSKKKRGSFCLLNSMERQHVWLMVLIKLHGFNKTGQFQGRKIFLWGF